jgi:hypothetical protein
VSTRAWYTCWSAGTDSSEAALSQLENAENLTRKRQSFAAPTSKSANALRSLLSQSPFASFESCLLYSANIGFMFVPTFALDEKRSRRPNGESKRRASLSLSSSNVPVGFRSNQVGPLLSKYQREKKQECRRRVEFYVARASEGGDKKMALLLHGVASRLTTLPAFLHGCHCFCTNKQRPNYECRRGQPGKQTCHATRVTPFLERHSC